MSLTGAEKRKLRHEGRSLRPSVVVGAAGLSDAVLAEIDHRLRRGELVKVKMPAGPARKSLSAELADRVGAELISLVGRSAVLYRARPDGEGASGASPA